jgi:hypothetical protein
MARIYLDDYVVEYSLTQRSFNVVTLRDMLAKNAHLILERRQVSDYLVIGVAKTREEADSIMNYFQKQIEDSENL